MTITVNMLEAKTGLLKLVEAVESGTESESFQAMDAEIEAVFLGEHGQK